MCEALLILFFSVSSLLVMPLFKAIGSRDG